jgi:cytochrome c biogenesis protein CcmG/thiol:disulfide interchange protein DsbE
MKRLPLLIFAILVVFLVIGLTLKPKEIPSPFIGKPAPNFELNVLNQSDTFAPKSMLGKVWLLNVWASWCTSCREEHPLLVEFSQQKMVPIIGLNYKDKDAEAIQWLKELGNPYDFSVVDSKGKVGIDYGVYGVPETFVIDKAGKIVHKQIGPLTPEALNKDILPLIKKLNS